MKTLKDIQFRPHKYYEDAYQGNLVLDNGLQFSVVYGGDSYSNEGTYEVACFFCNDMLRLGAYDDVIGYQTEEQFNAIVERAQNLGTFVEECQNRKNLAESLYS